LNRHAVATLADVGTPKVHCLRKRLQAVTPWTFFDCRNQLFNAKDAETLLSPSSNGDGKKPDFVVDAIDNIDSKVDLLAYCKRNDIKVISSMGAGCKSDPSRIFVGDISSSTDDPLSRATRRRLRAPPYHIASGVPVVYSTERPGPGKAELLPLPEEEFQKGKVGDLAPMQDFRVRILPVLGTMPAVFGYSVANYVILNIAGYPTRYNEGKGRDKMYESILAQLQGSEEKLARLSMPTRKDGKEFDSKGLKTPVTPGDIGYVVEEVWRGKSALSGIPTRLALVRWRRPSGMTVDISIEGQKASNLKLGELVCLTKEELAVHEKEVMKGQRSCEDVYGKEKVEFVEKLLEEERAYEVYR
jgi:tRNA A37 threonylcarbamoyladenosine dehydratase